jgi:acyl-coenzyme A thioesterase PaaI-like protein
MPTGLPFPLNYGLRQPFQPFTVAAGQRYLDGLPKTRPFHPESCADAFGLSQLEVDGRGNASAEGIITAEHGNPIGGIHGGAAVMLCEQIAQEAAASMASASGSERPEILSVSSSLLSSVRAKSSPVTVSHSVDSSLDPSGESQAPQAAPGVEEAATAAGGGVGAATRFDPNRQTRATIHSQGKLVNECLFTWRA